MNYEEQISTVNVNNPFMHHNHISAVALTADTARVAAPVTPDARNAMQGIHGGLMFLMAETAAGLLARNDGRRCVTVNCSFQYLRGSDQAKELYADSVIVKRGKTLCVCRSSVREAGTETVLAEGDFTFYSVEQKGIK